MCVYETLIQTKMRKYQSPHSKLHCSRSVSALCIVPPPDSWEIINLDSEVAEKKEQEANEVEQLRQTVVRYEDERKLLMDEITQLKEMLKREVNQAENDQKNNAAIINDYKLVRQRLDTQLHAVKAELDSLKVCR